MTVVAAGEKVINVLKEKFKTFRPTVKIDSYAGTFSIEEVKKLYVQTPALLVSPLESDSEGIKVVVYLLAKSTDKKLLEMVDMVISGIKHLPGEKQPLLKVAGKSLYDKEAGKIGARLWAFVTTIPHKLAEVSSDSKGGVVTAELSAISESIKSVLPGKTVAYLDRDISLMESEGYLPFILIKKGKGQFSTGGSNTSKYSDENNIRFQRKIIGAMELPIIVEVWGRDEAEAEELGLKILPVLQVNKVVDGLTKKIKVVSADSDSNEQGAALFNIGINLNTQIGSEPVRLPVFKNCDTDSE